MEKGLEDTPKRIKVDVKSLTDKILANFITKHLAFLLDCLRLSNAVFNADPEDCPKRADCQDASTIIHNLKVVND